MKNIIELLYDESARNNPEHEPDSLYTRMYNIRREKVHMLCDSMTKEQNALLDAYAIANENTEKIIQRENFRYAFYLGAQFMAELTESKEVFLK